MKDRRLQDFISEIESATSEVDLRAIALKFGILDALEQKRQKYPRFAYQFGEGIVSLQKTFDFELGLLKNENPTDLEKLLYAVSWKQGDVRKIKYVFEGLKATSNHPPKNGMTFWYFGKFLRDPIENPIIDRNVILAFAICKDYGNLERIRKISALSIKELGVIQDFIMWYQKDIRRSIRIKIESRELLDDLLFCVGQSLRKIHSAI